jgi:hypothetical protein
MKNKSLTICLMVIVCVMAVVNVASAGPTNGINLLTSEYHIWGNSYDIAGESPVSMSAYDTWEDEYTGINYGTYCSSSAGLLYVDVSTNAYPFGVQAGAGAEGTWTFRPEGSLLELEYNIYSWWGDPFKVELKDLTSEAQLYSLSGWAGVEPFVLTESLSLDCTHDYSLHMRILSTNDCDGPTWHGSIQATVIPIPDPASLTLSLLGLGAVIAVRRR